MTTRKEKEGMVSTMTRGERKCESIWRDTSREKGGGGWKGRLGISKEKSLEALYAVNRSSRQSSSPSRRRVVGTTGRANESSHQELVGQDRDGARRDRPEEVGRHAAVETRRAFLAEDPSRGLDDAFERSRRLFRIGGGRGRTRSSGRGGARS